MTNGEIESGREAELEVMATALESQNMDDLLLMFPDLSSSCPAFRGYVEQAHRGSSRISCEEERKSYLQEYLVKLERVNTIAGKIACKEIDKGTHTQEMEVPPLGSDFKEFVSNCPALREIRNPVLTRGISHGR